MYNALTLFCTLLLSCAVDFTQAHRRLLMQPRWMMIKLASRSYTSPLAIVTRLKKLAECNLVSNAIREFLTGFMPAFEKSYGNASNGNDAAQYQTALQCLNAAGSYPIAMQNTTQWITIIMEAKNLYQTNIFMHNAIDKFLAEFMQPFLLNYYGGYTAEYRTAMFCLNAVKHIFNLQ